ncbi:MAG: RNA polymerase sigma factor [Planctomycetota bacterium]
MSVLDTDQLLMRRFQEGDDHAFEVLVHEYQGLVLSLCRRYLGSRSPGVEDVAQEVFIRIFRGRMGYQPKARVKTWIYSITVNACLNEIRRLRSQKNRAVNSFTAVFGNLSGGRGAPEAVEEAPAVEPGASLDGKAAARRIRAAVDGLPEQQRLALILARYHHCSYEEVAETMGTTVPAVKSLLTRARRNLERDLHDLVEGAPGCPAPKSGTVSAPPRGSVGDPARGRGR